MSMKNGPEATPARPKAKMFEAAPPPVDISDLVPPAPPAEPDRPASSSVPMTGGPAIPAKTVTQKTIAAQATKAGFPSRERRIRRPRMTVRFEETDERIMRDIRMEGLQSGIEASLNDVVTAAVRVLGEMAPGKRLEILRAVAAGSRGR